MIKLNSTIYRKLLAQAEEAKEQGMEILADNIKNAIGYEEPIDEPQEYSYMQLQDDVYKEAWKLAAQIIKYYNLKTVNAEKLNDTILLCADKMIADVEHTLGVSSVVIGELEPKVPGENK